MEFGHDGLGMPAPFDQPPLERNLLHQITVFLPHQEPVLEGVSGSFLDPNFSVRLRKESFSGYGLLDYPDDSRAFFVLYQGRTVCAIHGQASALEAFQRILSSLAKSRLSLYKLQSPMDVLVCAPFIGILLAQGLPASSTAPADLLNWFGQHRFSGALVMEDGLACYAWYFFKGQLVHGNPIPERFRQGRLHVFSIRPSQLGSDLNAAVENKEQEKQQQMLALVWKAAEQVCQRHLGRSAAAALSRLRQEHGQTTPQKLATDLQYWLDEHLGYQATREFRQLLKRSGL